MSREKSNKRLFEGKGSSVINILPRMEEDNTKSLNGSEGNSWHNNDHKNSSLDIVEKRDSLSSLVCQINFRRNCTSFHSFERSVTLIRISPFLFFLCSKLSPLFSKKIIPKKYITYHVNGYRVDVKSYLSYHPMYGS